MAKNSAQDELETLNSMNTVVDTYEEIAAGRIRKTRDSVLKSRDFSDQIRLVFEQVRSSYTKEFEKLINSKKKKKGTQFHFLSNNGKTLYVLLSSNTGLYGDILRRTFDLFLSEIKKAEGDVAIIGRYGQTLFEESGSTKQVKYFDFPDNDVDQNLLKPIVEAMLGYENVIVFFGQFENVIKQTPIAYDVSATPIEQTQNQDGKKATVVKFIFEPSLEKILSVFEEEIFSSIVEQSMRESQLGKFASRMVSLDSALDNIKKKIKETEFTLDVTKHREQNRKQMERFASMKLWKR